VYIKPNINKNVRNYGRPGVNKLFTTFKVWFGVENKRITSYRGGIKKQLTGFT